jgi:hypothetical protein
MSLSNAEKQAAFQARKKQEGLRQFKIWLSEETAVKAENCYPGKKRLDALASIVRDGIQYHTSKKTPNNTDSSTTTLTDIKTCIEKWRQEVADDEKQKRARWANVHKFLCELEDILN